MTYEEFEEIMDNSNFMIDSSNPYDMKILELLEKQIPIEHHHTKVTDLSCARQSVCPKCLHIIITHQNEYPEYCTWCGQAIDWSDEE